MRRIVGVVSLWAAGAGAAAGFTVGFGVVRAEAPLPVAVMGEAGLCPNNHPPNYVEDDFLNCFITMESGDVSISNGAIAGVGRSPEDGQDCYDIEEHLESSTATYEWTGESWGGG